MSPPRCGTRAGADSRRGLLLDWSPSIPPLRSDIPPGSRTEANRQTAGSAGLPNAVGSDTGGISVIYSTGLGQTVFRPVEINRGGSGANALVTINNAYLSPTAESGININQDGRAKGEPQGYGWGPNKTGDSRHLRPAVKKPPPRTRRHHQQPQIYHHRAPHRLPRGQTLDTLPAGEGVDENRSHATADAAAMEGGLGGPPEVADDLEVVPVGRRPQWRGGLVAPRRHTQAGGPGAVILAAMEGGLGGPPEAPRFCRLQLLELRRNGGGAWWPPGGANRRSSATPNSSPQWRGGLVAPRRESNLQYDHPGVKAAMEGGLGGPPEAFGDSDGPS